MIIKLNKLQIIKEHKEKEERLRKAQLVMATLPSQ